VALGARLRSLRQAHGLTREEVAKRFADHGIVAYRATIGQIEQGCRRVSAYELTAFARLFETSLQEIVSGLPTPCAIAALSEAATETAARRLEAAPREVDAAARRLWGRSLVAEREARLGEGGRSRADQARRGHITRRLISELRAE